MQSCDVERVHGGTGESYGNPWITTYTCKANTRHLLSALASEDSEPSGSPLKVRLGAINITKVHGSSATVNEVARALSGLIVNATVREYIVMRPIYL